MSRLETRGRASFGTVQTLQPQKYGVRCHRFRGLKCSTGGCSGNTHWSFRLLSVKCCVQSGFRQKTLMELLKRRVAVVDCKNRSPSVSLITPSVQLIYFNGLAVTCLFDGGGFLSPTMSRSTQFCLKFNQFCSACRQLKYSCDVMLQYFA